jgi:hypothetical protein
MKVQATCWQLEMVPQGELRPLTRPYADLRKPSTVCAPLKGYEAA